MKTRSLALRFMTGAQVVALLTALAGAASAALFAHDLLEVREKRELRTEAAGLAGAIARELGEVGTSEMAATEAVRESVTSGHRVEIWRGSELMAASVPGRPLGPPETVDHATSEAWLIQTRTAANGLNVMVASPRERGRAALRIFGLSLVLSAPVCLALAAWVGRVVGRRAAAPLIDFKRRVGQAQPFQDWPEAKGIEPAQEIVELEAAFRDVWQRLGATVAREREFAANASHELRTPLTRIRLHAERAQAAPAQAGESLAELVAEVDRMVHLVDSLLVLSRDVSAGIPRAEVVNLADVVGATAQRVFADAGAPELLAPDEALVRGDEALLTIAVENLLENARKFAPPEGRAQVRVQEHDGSVRLSVASPGARIPAGAEARLFERFYRSPEARTTRAGHGLGLPLARHIARLHGGDVRLASEPGADACFELELPSWASATRA